RGVHVEDRSRNDSAVRIHLVRLGGVEDAAAEIAPAVVPLQWPAARVPTPVGGRVESAPSGPAGGVREIAAGLPPLLQHVARRSLVDVAGVELVRQYPVRKPRSEGKVVEGYPRHVRRVVAPIVEVR